MVSQPGAPSKVHLFNPSAPATLPWLHLAIANGFPPECYAECLAPLRVPLRVLALRPRPFFHPDPSKLRDWSLLVEDLASDLSSLGFAGGVGLGHSLGGVLTLEAALRRPGLFRALALVDPTLLPPATLRWIRLLRLLGLRGRRRLVQGALRRRQEWSSAKEAFAYFRSRPLFARWSDGMVRAYVEGLTGPAEGGGVRLRYSPKWEARIYETVPTNVWDRLQRLRGSGLPVLLVRGERSDTFPRESEAAFRRILPEAEIRVVPGAGHLVPQEEPAAVGGILLEFLRKCGV